MQQEFSHSQFSRCVASYYTGRMDLVLRIRELRQARGMTVTDLADAVGVSIPHMSGIERGVKNLNNHLIVRIAEALKVDPDDLIASDAHEDLRRLVTAMKRLDKTDQKRVEEFARALLLSQQEQSPSE